MYGNIIKTVIFIVLAFLISLSINTIAVQTSQYSSKEVGEVFLGRYEGQHKSIPKNNTVIDFTQTESNSCGPAAIRYLLSCYGTLYSEKEISSLVSLSNEGTSMLLMVECLDKLGFQGNGIRLDYDELIELQKPLIVFINGNHYGTITYTDSKEVYLFDPLPGKGLLCYQKEEFLKIWDGIALEVSMKPLEPVK